MVYRIKYFNGKEWQQTGMIRPCNIHRYDWVFKDENYKAKLISTDEEY